MLENINPAVDPCENFYDFACGGWMNKTVIPEYKSQFDLIYELRYHVDVQLNGKMKMKVVQNLLFSVCCTNNLPHFM